MRVAVAREVRSGERRVALVPESVKKLVKAGIAVSVQGGAGENAYFTDSLYRDEGAEIENDVRALYGAADLVLKVQAPAFNEAAAADEVEMMRPGSMLLGTLIPARHRDVLEKLAARGVSAFSIDQIPRITRAQAMDTLSSMANIAGYKATLIAANHLPKYFPMLMTAAGTVFPAKVFVIGAGVAGLQAIATAHRLGAAVEATDTRPVVKEQVESIGAKFVGVVADEAQDASGYAKELSAEFYRKQAELIAERCAAADAVITTALIGGVKAPKLITAEMVKAMKPGSVIVDLAAEAGGNCELTQPGRTVVDHGVTICGPENLPAEIPWHASTLYSRNLTAFVLAFWKDGAFRLDLDDEIIRGCLVTHGGEVRFGKAGAAA